MKFIAGTDEALAEELLSLSAGLGHTETLAVRTTSAIGFLVHDDVYDAWAGITPPAAEPAQTRTTRAPRRKRNQEVKDED